MSGAEEAGVEEVGHARAEVGQVPSVREARDGGTPAARGVDPELLAERAAEGLCPLS